MKKHLLFLALLFSIFHSQAQLDFYQQSPIMTDSYSVSFPTIVLLSDLDGDSDLDIIISSFFDKTIGWQENIDGAGTYGNIKLITDNADEVVSLHDIDIDGDGDIDLISGSQEDGKIAWYENDGLGNFGEQNVLVEYLSSVGAVFGSDVDSDGDIDIVARVECCTITWFENINGQGNFGIRNDIATMPSPTSIYLDDMDGDGDMDIVSNSMVEDQYIRIVWLRNLNGLGNFSSPQIVHTYIPETNYSVVSQVNSSDIDNDGDKDIVFTANNQMGWLENTDGLGNFTGASANIIIEDYIRNRFRTLLTEDIDDDGDLDIITSGIEWQDPGRIAWHENTNALGSFSGQNTMRFIPNGSSFIDIGDIDNDGDLDVASSANDQADGVVWFKNNGNHIDLDGPKYISKLYLSPSGAKFVDLDNDGDLDVINLVDYKIIVWYENLDGLGNLSAQKVLHADPDTYSIGRMQFTDINGDGNTDILATRNSEFIWFQNNGSANFSDPIIIPSLTGGTIAAFPGDMDGDDDMDLVIIRPDASGSNRVYYQENLDGLGTFGTFETVINLGTNFLRELIIRDFDGDNDNDIAFVGSDGSGSGGQIGWLENLDGTATFGPKIVLYNDEASSIDAADMDGDGDLDIITGTESSYLLAWFENTDGMGDFSSRQIIISRGASGLRDIEVADVDNDGDMDVVTGSWQNYSLEWFENVNGIADSFAQKTITNSIDNISSVSLGDFNSDGNVDVLLSAQNDDHIVTWFSNNGILTNRLNGQVSLDVNGDGCGASPDVNLANLRVETTNGSEIISTFTNSNGYFQMFPTQEGTYTTTIQSDYGYYSVSPSFVESIFTGYGNLEEANFCFTANQSINDLEISIIPLSDARPGFESLYALRYQNVGTEILSGNVVFDFDDTKLNYLNSSQSATIQTSNQLTFDYTNLNPFESRAITIRFQVIAPPTVNIDDVLNFTATINPIPGDITEPNNIVELNQNVIGSYDPNDITVREGPEINIEDVDEFLHYVIRFQNTGTASAINVQVENTLDPDLDWSTIELEYVKHAHYVEIMNGNKVKFIFENINLPDSTSNESASHGYIAYKIKPKSTSSIGDIFYNSAEIYFDYNLPIYTNIVATEIVDNLSVDDFRIEEQYIFPNPTNYLMMDYISSKLQVNLVLILSRKFLKSKFDIMSNKLVIKS